MAASSPMQTRPREARHSAGHDSETRAKGVVERWCGLEAGDVKTRVSRA
jgi:hypothetical protein